MPIAKSFQRSLPSIENLETTWTDTETVRVCNFHMLSRVCQTKNLPASIYELGRYPVWREINISRFAFLIVHENIKWAFADKLINPFSPNNISTDKLNWIFPDLPF